jgi:hypothetical protein
MKNPTDILARLAACGTPGDLLADVAILFGHLEATLERRERDRKRKQKQRSCPRMSADVTGHPLPPSSLKEKFPPAPPSKENTLFSPTPMRARQLPADFALTEADRNFACKRGWDGNRIASEFEHFCDHAAAKGRKLIDWHAGWRTWVQSPFNSGKVNGYVRPQRETVTQQAQRVAAKLHEAMVRADDSGGGGAGGGPDADSIPGNQFRMFG